MYTYKWTESLESVAGMLILASISYSVNIGSTPAFLLSIAGLLILIASKEDTILRIIVFTILNIPSTTAIFEKDLRFLFFCVIFSLFVIRCIRRDEDRW